MKNGNFFRVRFNTGGYGNTYAAKKDAVQDCKDTNRYTEAKFGEKVAVAVVQYKNWEIVREFAAE